MSVFKAILEWSESIPAWQSDAVARLLLKGKLGNNDMADLIAMLKAANGMADPQKRLPKKLSSADVPPTKNSGGVIKLQAIKNLKHVNALAENVRLPISTSGLTVIYGDNGAGKSGYTRVLKQACRARDREDWAAAGFTDTEFRCDDESGGGLWHAGYLAESTSSRR